MINYDLEGPKWNTSVVTWNFAAPGDPAFTSAVGAAYQATIRAAAAQWSAAGAVTLQEVAPGTPGTDVTVGWGSFSSSQIGQTDYLYQTGETQTFVPGMTIHIEDPSLLPLGTAPGSTYQNTSTTLDEVALHEFGHALGLGLSSDPSAVMYLYLGPNNGAIGPSDLAGLQALYGAANHGTPSDTPAATANASTPGATAPPPPDTITLSGDKVAVFRFFDTGSGTHFLTGSAAEADGLIATRPDMTYEGLGMAGIAPGANDPDAVPVFRFFDGAHGTQFLTSSASEVATVLANRPDLILEQTSFYEHANQQAGDSPVYRFFDTGNGTHFFTDSSSERASIAATRPDMTYEGIAFYAPSST